MSERLLYHLELANKNRREGDEEIRRLLDTLSGRVDGIGQAGIEEVKEKLQALEERQAAMEARFTEAMKEVDNQMEDFWQRLYERIDDRARTVKLELEERFDAIEGGLRDTWNNHFYVQNRLQRVEENLSSRVRVVLYAGFLH
jgi:hypothetical protein